MRKYGISLLSGLAASIACMGAPTPAQAVVVTSGSSSVVIQDTVTAATTGLAGDLIGKLTLGDFTFGAGVFTMSVLAQNLTNAALVPSGRLTAFAFNTASASSGVTDTSGVFNTFFGSNFPSVGKVDVCASTGPTCAGGGGGKLAPGTSNSFTLRLTGLAAGTTLLDLGAAVAGAAEIFYFKWQTGAGSFESQCTFGTTCGGGGGRGGSGDASDVPEPGSLTLLGGALIGLLAAGRRLRTKA